MESINLNLYKDLYIYRTENFFWKLLPSAMLILLPFSGGQHYFTNHYFHNFSNLPDLLKIGLIVNTSAKRKLRS